MEANTLKIIVLFATIFLFQGKASAQEMYVGDNTYIYASNQYIYLKNDLELKTTSSNFYLRNDGQLLQGTSGIGVNKGNGSLSVFQEGSVNNFQYNYWCSPVGSSTLTTSINNPFGIGLLGMPTSVTTTTSATILASNIRDGISYPLGISPYWIFKYVNNGLCSDWIFVGSENSIAVGEGFIMKGTSGTDTTTINGIQNNPGSKQRYDFRGKPNDGTIEISVLPGQWTLTGNPYPSTIDLQKFLSVATNPSAANCTGIAYFWEHDKTVNSHYIADYKGGYGSYSPAVDVYTPAVFYSYDSFGADVTTVTSPGIIYKRKYAPIGQGFFIEGKEGATGNVQMKNSFRVFVKEGEEYNSQFEKRTNTKTKKNNTETSQIRFNTLLNEGAVSQMVLVFLPESTSGVDDAMDAASPNDGPANNYFIIDGNEYVINVLPFNLDEKIPIGFRNSAQANYKITVNSMTNIPEVANVYFHDKTTNLYYDIKNSLYDFTLPAGTYDTRFEITFKNPTLGVEETKNQDLFIRQDNANKSFTINNPLLLEIDNCTVYDLVGRVVFAKKQLGTNASYTFPTSNLSSGIYIVKLSTNDKLEMGQKIIVKN